MLQLCRNKSIKILFDNSFRFSTFAFASKVDGRPCSSCGGRNLILRFLCGDCHILQNPELTITQLNYFEVFKMPVSLNIDVKKLERDFRTMQMFLHPDKFASSIQVIQNSSPNQKSNSDYASKYSSVLNEAYNTLKNEVTRAEYLVYKFMLNKFQLKLKGFHIDENTRFEDLEFMEEMLERRSEIEMTEDKNKILEYKKENDDQMEKIIQEVGERLEKGDYSSAFLTIQKLKYYDRVRHAISDWEEKYLIENLKH